MRPAGVMMRAFLIFPPVKKNPEGGNGLYGLAQSHVIGQQEGFMMISSARTPSSWNGRRGERHGALMFNVIMHYQTALLRLQAPVQGFPGNLL